MPGKRQLPVGPLVAGAGAVVLLVSLFLDWYDEFTAWTIFEVLDLVLAALAVASLLTVAREAGLGPRRAAVIGARALLPLAAAALVIAFSQLVNAPPAGVDRDPEVGIWLALAATAVMLAGALLATVRISLAVDVEPRAETEPPPAVPGADAAASPERPSAGGHPGSAQRPSTADPDAPTVARPEPERPEGPRR